jgi:hypothetical protein
LNIENQKNLDKGDGILGLSPEEDSYSTSFIEELKTQGLIEKRQVGFYLTNDVNSTSRVTFGGYADDMVKSNEQIRWYPLVDNKGQYTQWQHKIQDIRFFGQSIFSKKYNISVFNTASAKIIVP